MRLKVEKEIVERNTGLKYQMNCEHYFAVCLYAEITCGHILCKAILPIDGAVWAEWS